MDLQQTVSDVWLIDNRVCQSHITSNLCVKIDKSKKKLKDIQNTLRKNCGSTLRVNMVVAESLHANLFLIAFAASFGLRTDIMHNLRIIILKHYRKNISTTNEINKKYSLNTTTFLSSVLRKWVKQERTINLLNEKLHKLWDRHWDQVKYVMSKTRHK